MKSLKWNRVVLLLGVFWLGIFSPMKVMAAENVDTGKTVNLNIHFLNGTIPFENVEFRLYRVADMDANGVFTLTEEFRESGVKPDATDDAGLQEMAGILTDYIASGKNGSTDANGIEPDYKGVTDENGTVSLSGMPVGFYFVEGDKCEAGDDSVMPVPFLVSLPNKAGGSDWLYDVEVTCKYTIYKQEEPSTEPPASSEPTTEQTTESSTSHESSGEKFVTDTTDSSKLPQTGMLWWPVPVLLIGGILLIFVGLLIQKRT